MIAPFSVVASVHANSIRHYGWIPGKEATFYYESHVLHGIPAIHKSHFAGVKLTSKVIVQSYSDYSLRIKITEPVFITINGEVKLTETGRLTKHQIPESAKIDAIPVEFKEHLETPFIVYLKNGVVETFSVGKNEPLAVTNLKKSVLSQINLDILGTRRPEIETNLIRSSLPVEGEVFFTTYEESLQGECLTEYTVHKLPQWRISELEENWIVEELEVLELPINTQFVPLGKKECEGKPYYMITKTKDFEKCKVIPFFQKWSGASGLCDITKSGCENLVSVSNKTQTVLMQRKTAIKVTTYM